MNGNGDPLLYGHIRHTKKRAFLRAFGLLGSIRAASKAAECNHDAHYYWMARDPTYAAAFLQAQEQAADELERIAVERATQGWVETTTEYEVAENGDRRKRRAKEVKRLSNTLLIFLLKGFRPDKYRERYSVEHAGGGEAFIQAVGELIAKHLKGPALRRFEGDLGTLLTRTGNGEHNHHGNRNAGANRTKTV